MPRVGWVCVLWDGEVTYRPDCFGAATKPAALAQALQAWRSHKTSTTNNINNLMSSIAGYQLNLARAKSNIQLLELASQATE